MITSEFGLALLLDNHVNRPGYVIGCIAAAISHCSLQPADLAGRSDDDERQVLDAYLDIRQTYGKHPMTHAEQRGEVTRRYLADGIISDRRNSFESNRS